MIYVQSIDETPCEILIDIRREVISFVPPSIIPFFEMAFPSSLPPFLPSSLPPSLSSIYPSPRPSFVSSFPRLLRLSLIFLWSPPLFSIRGRYRFVRFHEFNQVASLHLDEFIKIKGFLELFPRRKNYYSCLSSTIRHCNVNFSSFNALYFEYNFFFFFSNEVW